LDITVTEDWRYFVDIKGVTTNVVFQLDSQIIQLRMLLTVL